MGGKEGESGKAERRIESGKTGKQRGSRIKRVKNGRAKAFEGATTGIK